jgi:hypothetical protein
LWRNIPGVSATSPRTTPPPPRNIPPPDLPPSHHVPRQKNPRHAPRPLVPRPRLLQPPNIPGTGGASAERTGALNKLPHESIPAIFYAAGPFLRHPITTTPKQQ